MNDIKKQLFNEWFAELKKIAKEKYNYSEKAVESFDSSWKDFYDEGFSPSEAIEEDLSGYD